MPRQVAAVCWNTDYLYDSYFLSSQALILLSKEILEDLKRSITFKLLQTQ